MGCRSGVYSRTRDRPCVHVSIFRSDGGLRVSKSVQRQPRPRGRGRIRSRQVASTGFGLGVAGTAPGSGAGAAKGARDGAPNSGRDSRSPAR